jgi:DNA-binding response OmpR family regulator
MNDQATILAVDDTPESLALLVKLLTSAGYQVRPADSGELALAAVAADPPDLVLLDVCMKGVDGLEVCRRLKARDETRHIPIILISAFADVMEWVEGLQVGAADYITKPFQPEELLTRVKTHLTLSRMNVALEQQAAARGGRTAPGPRPGRAFPPGDAQRFGRPEVGGGGAAGK